MGNVYKYDNLRMIISECRNEFLTFFVDELIFFSHGQ